MMQANSINLTYLSLKTEKRESTVHGRGLFAVVAIAKEETIAVKGGHIYGWQTHRSIEQRFGPTDVQIAEDLFIGPLCGEEVEGCMLHLNHSCDPNVGIRGEITFVTMREIAEGEELTFDYAMTDDEEYNMPCHCGSELCRGVVNGSDWKLPELQVRYRRYFSNYLQEKIVKGE